ncbi:MAG: hypothetical protein K6L80_14240 [Agarilytica sp.]
MIARTNIHHLSRPKLALITLFLVFIAPSSWSLSVPNDPSQSIRYWKPQVITPASDPQVDWAHDLFKHLLGAWDISRVEPALNVIKDSSGPWAASLSDGNILLSRSAIDICLSFGDTRGKHLLAFVLAHELAHQKGNDLWHQQFFRLIGNQSPEITEEIHRDLAIDQNHVSQLESLEAQADLDAVVMMASVGYDPYQIIKGNDFYTAWIENIWQAPCSMHTKSQTTACSNAKDRALRTQAQLESITDQAILYELGIQSLIAKQYEQARAYLTAYARNFPGRSAHNSIGVSYIAEAIALWPEYAAHIDKPNLYFPLFVEATPSWKNDSSNAKRGSTAQLKANIHTLAEQALNYFDKAQRLSPHHRETHYLRAMSYLLMENTPMANGIIEGQYIPAFGRDTSSDLLRALSDAMAGKSNRAQDHLESNIRRRIKTVNKDDMPILFAMVQNQAQLADFHQQANEAKKIWKNFAQAMSKKGESYLLQLALSRLNPSVSRKNDAYQLNYQNITVNHPLKRQGAEKTQIWFDGEPIHVHRDQGGVWLSDKHNKVIALRLNTANFSGLERLKIGDSADRVIRVMGPADRQIALNSGRFLAYDQHGFALRISQDKIASWFLYPSM